jgi:hypothetical protein
MYNRQNANDPWDPSNAVPFLEYTAQQGYDIYGFELGNELTTKVCFFFPFSLLWKFY